MGCLSLERLKQNAGCCAPTVEQNGEFLTAKIQISAVCSFRTLSFRNLYCKMRGSYLFLQVLALLGSATAFWGMAPKMPSSSTTLRMMSEDEMDPNFEAHLPSMLKVGLQERPSYDIARELRQKYHDSVRTKRVAATALRSVNKELAVEVCTN